jgi:hypothetical protein
MQCDVNEPNTYQGLKFSSASSFELNKCQGVLVWTAPSLLRETETGAAAAAAPNGTDEMLVAWRACAD